MSKCGLQGLGRGRNINKRQAWHNISKESQHLLLRTKPDVAHFTYYKLQTFGNNFSCLTL